MRALPMVRVGLSLSAEPSLSSPSSLPSSRMVPVPGSVSVMAGSVKAPESVNGSAPSEMSVFLAAIVMVRDVKPCADAVVVVVGVPGGGSVAQA